MGGIVHEKEVNYHILTHQEDNEGYSPFWFGLVAVKSRYLASDIIDLLM